MDKAGEQYYGPLNFNIITDIKTVWKVVKPNSSNETSSKERDITIIRKNLHLTRRKLLQFFKNE